jgi:hypothetical protein
MALGACHRTHSSSRESAFASIGLDDGKNLQIATTQHLSAILSPRDLSEMDEKIYHDDGHGPGIYYRLTRMILIIN